MPSTNCGLVSSKNTHFWALKGGLTDGPRTVSPVLKVLITVVLALERSSAEILSRLTTKLVCTLESKSPVSTRRSCLLSGNTRSVLARVLNVSQMITASAGELGADQQ